MEKRIQTKIDTYNHTFKHKLIDWIKDTNISIMSQNELQEFKNKLINMITYEPTLTLSKDDFNKRKRTKNNIPLFDRCMARRASGEQCTRRKKEGIEFCGTHEKGQPHGVFDNVEPVDYRQTTTKVVETIKIMGINYFVDNECNIYNPQDVLENKLDPKKIGKCEKIIDGSGDISYNITELYDN